MEEKIEEINEAGKSEVKILGILCNWCSYAGADLAGTSRFQYNASIRIVRVMCSGRIDPMLILNAFKSGADGILIGGCHPGDCHYKVGNYHAYQKIKFIEKILDIIEIDKRRLRLEWISAAEGQHFSKVVNEFSETINQLGNISLSDKQLELLNLSIDMTSDFRMRWLIGNKLKITTDGNVYEKIIPEEEFDNFLDEVIKIELLRRKILKIIENEALSAPQISEEINVDKEVIMKNLIALMTERKVSMEIKHHDAYWRKETN